jgi:lysophospholipid acyltransferase (LPLAT)-like uncharacterized protein
VQILNARSKSWNQCELKAWFGRVVCLWRVVIFLPEQARQVRLAKAERVVLKVQWGS